MDALYRKISEKINEIDGNDDVWKDLRSQLILSVSWLLESFESKCFCKCVLRPSIFICCCHCCCCCLIFFVDLLDNFHINYDSIKITCMRVSKFNLLSRKVTTTNYCTCRELKVILPFKQNFQGNIFSNNSKSSRNWKVTKKI